MSTKYAKTLNITNHTQPHPLAQGVQTAQKVQTQQSSMLPPTHTLTHTHARTHVKLEFDITTAGTINFAN